MGIRCKNCHAPLYPNHLFLQEFASIVVEDCRAKPLDEHITNHACFFIHREVEEDDDHDQKVQEIEHGEPIVIEALLEGYSSTPCSIKIVWYSFRRSISWALRLSGGRAVTRK